MSTKLIESAFVKAIATVDAHELEFYAIAFSSEPDKQGDRIDPAAADEWLERFYAKGRPLPISFRHAAMLGESRSDPESVIGYAPATPEHVWKDEHGIRVRAFLYEGQKAAAVYRLASDGVLTGASAVFSVHPDDEEHLKDHSTMIRRISEIKEAGPCLDPANDDAYMVAVKADINKAWDGAAAMRSCDSAADFRKIAFELRNDSDPDSAAHWALPHHDSPGAGPNQGGVSAALGRLNQTGATVLSKDAIRGHLEAHQPAERAAAFDPDVLDLVAKAGTVAKVGRSLSSKNEQLLRTAMSMIEQALSSIAALQEEVAEEEKAEDSEPRAAESPNAWISKALAEEAVV